MTNNSLSIENSDGPSVVLLGYSVPPGEFAHLVPGLPPELLPAGADHSVLFKGVVAVTRWRLAVLTQRPLVRRRVRDQRPRVAVAARWLSAHVALSATVLVGHVRHLDLTCDASPGNDATLDLLVDGVVLADEAPREVQVRVVVAVQLVVVATVPDLRVGVVEGRRGSATASARCNTCRCCHLVSPTTPTLARVPLQCHRAVRPRRVLLLGTSVPRVTRTRLKRNVLL